MLVAPGLTAEILAPLSVRTRAVLKLRIGLPLSEEELLKVLPENREAATEPKPRSLREVGRLLGVCKERVRQLEEIALRLLEKAAQGERLSSEDACQAVISV